MTTVNIKPLDRFYITHNISMKFRPMPPPIFDGAATDEDILLARELFRALDSESQEWYWHNGWNEAKKRMLSGKADPTQNSAGGRADETVIEPRTPSMNTYLRTLRR